MPETLRLFSAVTSLMLLVCLEPMFAHDEPYHRINEITIKIESNPRNPDLYIERGELYRLTSQLDLALSDFDRLSLLDPDNETVNYHCGRLLFEAGQYQAARIALDQFVSVYPDQLQGLMVRARVLRKLKQPLLAVQDYSYALSLVSYPAPVLIVEQAEALVEVGEPFVDLAIQSLNEAIQKHGPLILLESCAIELELGHGHYDAALARIDRILQGMTRKEKWLLRRGEILEKAGRIEEARAAYEDALKALASLPHRLQQIPASQALVADLNALLERHDF
jgi:tetratricopeptide (TPR) repeat protein